MPQQINHLPERPEKPKDMLAWLREFFSQFGLAWQLFWDERVPFSTKLVPILTMLYLFVPIDLVPDAFLGVGQVDDLVILLVGLRLFISLCPLELVDEYKHQSNNEKVDTNVIPDDATIIDLDIDAESSGDVGSELKSD